MIRKEKIASGFGVGIAIGIGIEKSGTQGQPPFPNSPSPNSTATKGKEFTSFAIIVPPVANPALHLRLSARIAVRNRGHVERSRDISIIEEDPCPAQGVQEEGDPG